MADDRLRELERAALTGDPEAKRAFLREMLRARDPRVVAAEEAKASVAELLKRFRDDLAKGAFGSHPGDYRRWTCPELKLPQALLALQTALAEQADQDFGFGFKELGSAWPEDYEEGQNAEIESFEDLVYPNVVLAFVARKNDEVTVGIGASDSRKPTPGTAFSTLAPWRKKTKPQTLSKKIDAWLDGLAERRKVSFSAETARLLTDLLWLDVPAEPTAAPAYVPVDERPSEAQLRYVDSLVRNKGLDDAAFAAQLAAAGVQQREELDRRSASDLIDALLALPDASKKKKAKKKKAKTSKPKPAADKRSWLGEVLSVQPRIRLRVISDDEQHSYQGFVLNLRGNVEDEQRIFSVGVGKAAQTKHAFRAGDTVSGVAVPVADPTKEAAELYKASKLAVESRGEAAESDPPPWTGAPPELPTFRANGHRSLAAQALSGECGRCYWGCRMPLDGDEEGFRVECYGPKDCSLFEAGAK